MIIPSIRQNALNSLEYGGPEVARLQHTFYPDIGPLVLDVPIDGLSKKRSPRLDSWAGK